MTRVALPRFTLSGSFFHAMISYRSASEGQAGNNLGFEIYEMIRALSLESEQTIPQYGWGALPLYARKPDQYQPKQAKVYLDTQCLLDGHDWEAGFIQGVSSSIVMVCLLSFNKYSCGSLGDLLTLCPGEGKDRVDNVLLELILGLELRAHGEQPSLLPVILPILVGPQRPDSSFEPFPMGVLDRLSPEPSVMTNDKAASILFMLGVGDKQIQAMQARSVREHVDLILQIPGVDASTYASQNDLVRGSAQRCLMMIKRQLFTIRTHPSRFANNRPGGQEVLEWLREKQLCAYIPIFLYYGLDTLLLISNLSDDQVSRLVDEYRDIYFVAHKKESLSLDNVGQITAENEESTTSSLRKDDVYVLMQAIQDLAHNPLARTMAWRLEWFEDTAGDFITIVWARNCLERYMELRIFFILVSLLMISNLVQLQADFVTWSDYFQENYVFKVQECLTVVWQASLRTLGYNGRSIQRDLSAIFLAFFFQKCLAHILIAGRPANQEEKTVILFHMFHCLFTSCFAKYRPEYYTAYLICVVTGELCAKLLVTSNPLIAPIVIFLVTSYIILNRPEYYGGYHICMAMVFHAMQNNASEAGAPAAFVTSTIAPAFIFVFWIHYMESSHKVVFGKKVKTKMAKFRIAWKESSDPEALAEMTKMCKEISGVLIQQRDDALHMLSLFDKARAYLDERVGRWILRGRKGTVKARQKCSDIDVLFSNAGAINEPFQELVSKIGFNGCSVNHSAGLEFVAGPVKQPTRALEKLVRRYRRDFGCLTDLVRCSVIADSLKNVNDFLRLLYSTSVAGLDTSFEEEGRVSKGSPGEHLDTGDQLFRITSIENRFDSLYDDEESMGYRDLALNVEVGWIVIGGTVSIQLVRDWRRLNCTTHICEIQIRTKSGHVCAQEGHQDYLVLRNGLSL